MPYPSLPIRQANEIQRRLIKACGREALAARAAEAWIAVERMKREMRGIPPLAPFKLDAMKQARRVIELAGPTEDEPKESVSGQTVTAGPPAAPRAPTTVDLVTPTPTGAQEPATGEIESKRPIDMALEIVEERKASVVREVLGSQESSGKPASKLSEALRKKK